MSKLDKLPNRRTQPGNGKTLTQKKTSIRKGKTTESREAPFHGSLHSEHPRDPFRNIFGDSSQKFDF